MKIGLRKIGTGSIFSDETKIYRINSNDIRYTQGKDLSKVRPEMDEYTLKFGGRNLLMWARISWSSADRMDLVLGRMNSE